MPYQRKHAAPFPVGAGFFQFSMNEYIVQVDCLLFFIIDLQWTFISVSKLKEQNAHSPPPTLLLPQKLKICNLRHTKKCARFWMINLIFTQILWNILVEYSINLSSEIYLKVLSSMKQIIRSFYCYSQKIRHKYLYRNFECSSE